MDHCGLQQPVLCEIEETVNGSSGQSRRLESRTTRVTIQNLSLVLFLFDLIRFNGHITAGFYKIFVISAALIA